MERACGPYLSPLCQKEKASIITRKPNEGSATRRHQFDRAMPSYDEMISHDHSSDTSSWESDVSIGPSSKASPLTWCQQALLKTWKTWDVMIASSKITTIHGSVTLT